MGTDISICGTGHRPDKLSGGYSQKTFDRLTLLAKSWLSEHSEVKRVISGVALGWDQALATAASELKIPWTAAVPFKGQELRWPPESQRKYQALIKTAAEVVIVCQGPYSAKSMQIRNEWMVDRADLVLALWNGTNGGTENCVKYAVEQKKPLVNLWDKWKGLE